MTESSAERVGLFYIPFLPQFPYNVRIMNPSKTYAVNSQKAISETLDGETIIIDLETGSYYSMNKAGSKIWEYLQAGYSIDAVANTFEDKKPVLDLVELLIADNLIAENQNPPADLAPLTLTEFPTAPTITKYEDMQEMLLADPVHDVEASGWPNIKS